MVTQEDEERTRRADGVGEAVKWPGEGEGPASIVFCIQHQITTVL